MLREDFNFQIKNVVDDLQNVIENFEAAKQCLPNTFEALSLLRLRFAADDWFENGLFAKAINDFSKTKISKAKLLEVVCKVEECNSDNLQFVARKRFDEVFCRFPFSSKKDSFTGMAKMVEEEFARQNVPMPYYIEYLKRETQKKAFLAVLGFFYKHVYNEIQKYINDDRQFSR